MVTLEQFGEQAVQRYCAQVGACCSELSYPFDEAGCEALNGNNIVQYFNFEFFPGAHYDAAAGQRCLDGIETPELGCAASGDYKSADCQKVFIGSVPLGGTCSLDEGCAEADGAATECDLPFDPSREDQDPKRTGVCVLAPPAVTSPHGKLGDARLLASRQFRTAANNPRRELRLPPASAAPFCSLVLDDPQLDGA